MVIVLGSVKTKEKAGAFLNLKIKIIAVDGRLRNPGLMNDLSNHFPSSAIQIVSAIKPADLPNKKLDELVGKSSFVVGRKVTQTEVAVMLSHQKCYTIAIEEDCNFLMVLEDDVKIEKYFNIAESLNHLPESEIPIIWTYFKSPWSAWHVREKEKISSYPPPCAAAYIMNRAALLTALSEESVGVADWPTWGFGVRFKLIEKSGFVLMDAPSYVESERERNITGNSILAIFKGKPSSQSISRKWPFIFRILIPLKWRFYRIKSRILHVN